jgi:hypothetical protein
VSDAGELHVILPVQHLTNGAGGLAAPQRRLMLAVLQAVLDDCEWQRPGSGVPTPRDRQTRLQALAYVESADRSWPFSFENICEAIGLDVALIRSALRRHASRNRVA